MKTANSVPDTLCIINTSLLPQHKGIDSHIMFPYQCNKSIITVLNCRMSEAFFKTRASARLYLTII